MQANSSDADFPKSIRRAASEAAASGSRRSRRSRSDASRSNMSGSSYYSRSSSASLLQPLGMSLKEQQQHVANEAWARHVAALELEAKQTVEDNNFYGRTIQGGLQEEKNEASRARNLAKQNQEQIKSQMSSNKDRRAETRREYIEAASSHSFPLFTETFISVDEVEAYHKKQKEKWREELNMQAKVNQTLRNVEERAKHDHALVQQSLNLKNMGASKEKDVSHKLALGRELKAAWDRDIRLKGISKAILTGRDMTFHAGVENSKFPRPGDTPGNTGYLP